MYGSWADAHHDAWKDPVAGSRVDRRTQEFGLRLALGATLRHVVWLALSEGLALPIGGVALGLAATLAGSRGVQSFLFRVDSIDIRSYATLATVMMLVVLTAVYLPPAGRCGSIL